MTQISVQAAQRCPGGGRSPAPASVYIKVVPLKLAPWRARQAATWMRQSGRTSRRVSC